MPNILFCLLLLLCIHAVYITGTLYCRTAKIVAGIKHLPVEQLLKKWRCYMFVLCLVAQLCPILSNPMDCSPPGSSVHGDSPGKNTGMCSLALLQRIFPTHVSCITGELFTILDTRETQEYWSGSLSLLKEIFLTQQLNRDLSYWSCILYQLRHQGSLLHV